MEKGDLEAGAPERTDHLEVESPNSKWPACGLWALISTSVNGMPALKVCVDETQ